MASQDPAVLRHHLVECHVPIGLHDGLIDYVVHHTETGSFLDAVLANDLKEACGRADVYNRFALFQIVDWLYNHADSNCWGSRRKVDDWLANAPRINVIVTHQDIHGEMEDP